MSHHVPGPPDYDVVMTEQVSGQNDPKMLGGATLVLLLLVLCIFKHTVSPHIPVEWVI